MTGKKELTDSLEKVEANLCGFLASKDERFIEDLVKETGRTREEATRLAAWDWTHGIGLYGLLKCYQFDGNERYLDEIQDWFEDRILLGLPEKNVNTVAPLLTMAFLQEIRPDDRYVKIMQNWAEWIMHDMERTEEGGIQHRHAELENSQELWDDTLMMTVLFLAKAGMLFHRQEYVEEAIYQFLLHVKYLTDTESGLWYHGWSFLERGNFAKSLWGRGNCWITIFIPEFLEIVPLPESIRRYAVSTLREQAKALKRYQAASGMWHTLIDDETSYEESSCTAGFCYGILKGIRKGYLEGEYEECGIRALEALIGKIDVDGEVTEVSKGTNVGRTLEHYRQIPMSKMHYGQALALIALIEGKEWEKLSDDESGKIHQNFEM